MSGGVNFPDEYTHGIYDALVVDPRYARGFTWTYLAALGVGAIVALPRLVQSIRARRLFTGLGLWENMQPHYDNVVDREKPSMPASKPVSALRTWLAFLRLKGELQAPLRGINIDFAQFVGIVAYFVALLYCLLDGHDLLKNADRAGFVALAQLPLIFIFATKNGVLQLLFGHGYEKLNWIHRWAGRGMFVAVVLHGGIWLNTKTELRAEKLKTGLPALGIFCVLVATSLSPLRRWFYQGFFAVHVISYTALFVLICYHTEYAPPYIFPPIAFYAFDVFVRFLRFRIKSATISSTDNVMTLIHVHDVDGGWTAGQHVRLRVFFSGRFFESHPLTIVTAPSKLSCSSSPGGILLGSRAQGPWSSALNALAREDPKGVRVSVMLDGPYGGCAIDLARSENVLLVAGGSGITFALGVLDDLVGRIARQGRRFGERTRRIDLVWCIRSFGCLFWFQDLMMDIALKAQEAGLELNFNVFVTCLCDPEAVPHIPRLEVTMEKPTMKAHLASFLSPSPDGEAASPLPSLLAGGGLAIAVCGPRALTNEAQNTVALLSPAQMRRLGGVELHVEHFSL